MPANNAVALGDVNGDGIPDLVAAATSNALTIAIGYGDGRFHAPSAITSASATSFSGVTLADLDGQHGLDIIAADPGGNQVWVFLNQGAGTFGTPTALATGLGPKSIAAADLNGDGYADIVTANGNGNNVSVLLGNGNGTFQAHRDITVDTQPVAVAIADFNKDGCPDLVTANSGGNTLSVLLGKGDGHLPGQDGHPDHRAHAARKDDTQDAAVSNPTGVAVGDFNGDLIPDLVTANSGRASVNVMLGNGDGSFGLQQTIDTLLYDANDPVTPDSPTAVVAADLDGDGFVDIAFTEPKHGRIGVLSGNGDGTFAARVDQVAANRPTVLVAGNLNGDHTSLGWDRLDLVAVSSSDSRASILLGQKYATTATLTATASTFTYGSSTSLKAQVTSGISPQGLSLTGSCQIYVDGHVFGSPVPLGGSTSTTNTLAAGPHTLYMVYAGNADYLPSTSSSVVITVTPAKLTVTAIDMSRIYGEVNPALTYAITGMVNNDLLDQSKISGAPVISTTALGRTSPAGVYPITITAGTLHYADPNYTIDPTQFTTGKLTVAPAVLTVTADSPTRPYGGANPGPLTYTPSGFVNNENAGVLTGSPTLSTLATTASPVGEYPIVITRGSLGAANYTFVYVASTLTVAPAVLTVTPSNATRVYGAPAPVITYTVTGFVNGETNANAYTGAPTLDTPTTPVGLYDFTPGLGTLSATNYTLRPPGRRH